VGWVKKVICLRDRVESAGIQRTTEPARVLAESTPPPITWISRVAVALMDIIPARLRRDMSQTERTGAKFVLQATPYFGGWSSNMLCKRKSPAI